MRRCAMHIIGIVMLAALPPASGRAAPASDDVDFNRDVRPILSNHCWSCHGTDEKGRQAGLRLDQRESALRESDSGETPIVPYKPAASHLIARVDSSDDDVVMPPPSAKKPLTSAQRDVLRRWIAAGAPYAPHWAFTPIERPALPAVRRSDWAINDIDRFVLARLEQEGLSPSPAADRTTWLRRVTLDLTGLPPTPDERAAFLADDSPQANETIVDRLLNSPRHAERLTMHWLDAARYADTNGYNNDDPRTMWPWRDWVIGAFARNMPYDQFITEQIAGDLLPNPTLEQRIATGFSRNHVITTEGGVIEEEYHVEYVADRVHTASTVLLALSLQCARCHDHKFDPISQREYYQFAAFFGNLPDKSVDDANGKAADPVIPVPNREQREKLAQLAERRSTLEESLQRHTAQAENAELKECLSTPPAARSEKQRTLLAQHDLTQVDAQVQELQKELADLAKETAAFEGTIPRAMIMQEMSPARSTFLLKAGQYDQRLEEVTASVPAALLSLPQDAPRNRRGLARWLVDPQHPLTARVAVNRWWEMFFGMGLVETSADFGVQGALPSHPQLLDLMASELISNGWNQRAILKQIALSATYRQSSAGTPAQMAADPHNRLLARGPRGRLQAEIIRDCALAVSGLLCERVGGPSVKPYQPAGLWEDVSVERRAKYEADSGEGLYRRSMYTYWKRTCPPPSMSLFDAPDRETCVVRRASTNTPLQALVLLNDPTYLESARKLAELVVSSTPCEQERLQTAFFRVLCRAPQPDEEKLLIDACHKAAERFRHNPASAAELIHVGSSAVDPSIDPVELSSWTIVMSMLLNLDEAICKP